jgi:hypothetical protein
MAGMMRWDSRAFEVQVAKNALRKVTAICVTGVAYAKTHIPRVPDSASPPGGFPFGKTMNLEQNITYTVEATFDGIHGLFGVIPVEGRKGSGELGYAYLLETGTSKMLPRPWLTLTMDAVEAAHGVKFERSI